MYNTKINKIDIYNKDCIEILPTLPKKSVNLILTDLPYGITRCKWDSIIPLEFMWKELNRIIKNKGVIALFGSEPFSSTLRISNIKNYKYDWVWCKNKSTNFLNASKQPLRNIETISIFRGNVYYPQKTVGHKPVNFFTKHNGDGETLGKTLKEFRGGGQTDRFPTQVLKFNVINNDNSGKNKFHPTQKPVELLEYLIKTYTLENETVLDFTMGSGSTGVACLNINRNFIGIEKDETYFNIAKERIEKCQNEIKRKLF